MGHAGVATGCGGYSLRFPRVAGELPRADALRDLTEAFLPLESPGIPPLGTASCLNTRVEYFFIHGTPRTVLSKALARKTSSESKDR